MVINSIKSQDYFWANEPQLTAWVIQKHGDQKRDDGSPYINHLFGVAELIRTLTDRDHSNCDMANIYRAVLCHDLLEDTNTKEDELLSLTNSSVLYMVKELTDEPGTTGAEKHHKLLRKMVHSCWESALIKIADRYYNVMDAINTPQWSYMRVRKYAHKGRDLMNVIAKVHPRLKDYPLSVRASRLYELIVCL